MVFVQVRSPILVCNMGYINHLASPKTPHRTSRSPASERAVISHVPLLSDVISSISVSSFHCIMPSHKHPSNTLPATVYCLENIHIHHLIIGSHRSRHLRPTQ